MGTPSQNILVQSALWKTVWRYLRKLNIKLPYDPEIPLLGLYPDKTFLGKDTCTHMLIAALFTIAKTCKQPKCPSTDEWIKKMWYLNNQRKKRKKKKTQQLVPSKCSISYSVLMDWYH